MTKNVLITGGAGFIGCHLGRHLAAEGYNVYLLDNFSRGVEDEELSELQSRASVELINADLGCRSETLALGVKFEYVVHLAAIIGVAHVVNRPYSVLVENVRMLESVIELCRSQSEFSRLVFASTSEVYAGTLEYFGLVPPTMEQTPLAVSDLSRPRTSYMLSKIYGEALCAQSGLPFSIVRPHNVYGPRMGMSHVVPEQLAQIWKSKSGDRIGVRSLDHRRTFCYVSDAVQMIERVMLEKACEQKTLNIGSPGPEITIRQLVEHCIRVSGKKLHIDPLSDTDGSPVRRCPDMSQMTRYTGYLARVQLNEGIERTWDWYSTRVFTDHRLTAD